MIQFYVYDTATGRVLGTGSYDERGDGAAARAIVAGVINSATEYAPGGVKTARPTFNLVTLLLDKTAILADATDTATLTGVPVGTLIKVFKDAEAFPRSVVTVNDGTLLLRVDAAGVYRLQLSNFPTQDYAFTVAAT